MAAELMEIKKPYQDGLLREFAVKDIENFQNHGKVKATWGIHRVSFLI